MFRKVQFIQKHAHLKKQDHFLELKVSLKRFNVILGNSKVMLETSEIQFLKNIKAINSFLIAYSTFHLLDKKSNQH